MEVPKRILEKISTISKQRGVSEDVLIKEFEEICNTGNVKDYPDDQKFPYAGNILWVRYMSKEPTKEFSLVVPFGVNERRMTKSGFRGEIYALVQEPNGSGVVKEIVCKGSESELPNKLELYKVYKGIQLTDRGFLEASPTTKFNTPGSLPSDTDEIGFLTKFCKFKKLSELRDMATNPSKVDSQGYSEKTDMRIISGMTARFSKGERKNKSQFGVYNIKDDSLGLESQPTTVNGQPIVIPSTITVWVPHRFALYDTESELSFVGTIQIGRRDKMPFMNAYAVIPSGIVREIGGEEK